MNGYLIPANANRGKLIFSYFRLIDLFILGGGLSVTFLLLLIFQSRINEISVAILVLLPGLITGFLVFPVPYQHNVLVVLQNIYRFYFVDRRKYIWRGWCSLNGKDE